MQPEPGVPLLATKLFAPRWRRGQVSRPRLIARREHGADRKLILVCAPAGFGKSTLLAEWLANTPAGSRSVAWLSLELAQNDPTRFSSYVIAALQRVHAGVGASALAMLRASQPPPPEAMLGSLINELSALDGETVLVFDDYHLIENHQLHEAMTFLLDHLPPQLHLAIASRSDPPLPLARLRGRGEVTELRVAELRFTAAEAGAFLSDGMGLDLSTADVVALEGRTEGWIAGLQLAALSLQGHQDATAFIRTFAGDHRYVADYLIDEVLRAANRPICAISCSKPPCSTGSPGRSAMPLPDRREAPPGWRRWSAAISSSCRWTTGGAGTAITTSSPTCCAHI